jgi:NAD(P)H-flavin reductase
MSPPEPRLVRAEIAARTSLSPRVRRLALVPRGPEGLDWLPGQYVEVGPVGADKRQPYSVASAPDSSRPGYFELAVLRGSGNGALDDLAVGDLLEVFGPKGRFVWNAEGDVPSVFIGTGTGVAPLRAMLQVALAGPGSAPLVLLFGVRSEGEILWHEELRALSERHPRFQFEPTLSQPTNGWAGRRGRVQEHLQELVAPLPGARFYLCGLGEMVQDCVARLTGDLGVARELVITEEH